MRKVLISFLCLGSLAFAANAYQVGTAKELGSGEAKNQNMTIQCTSDTGAISSESCIVRRYAKCSTINDKQTCNEWKPWKNVHAPQTDFATWREAAEACCRQKGLR